VKRRAGDGDAVTPLAEGQAITHRREAMKTLYEKLVSLVREEEGTETVEWALVAGLLVIIGAAGYTLVGGDVATIHNNLQDASTEAAGNTWGG
jgi:Flp pilus assembly pilin Flp